MPPESASFDPIDQALMTALRQQHPAMLMLCSQLLQTPSVNGVHPERALAEQIATTARALGLHAEIIALEADRPNVIVSTAPSGETGLLLIGHLDTVPPGDETRWRFPPFSGTMAEGRIYGRGAIDTKGGMTSALFALQALAQTPGALPKGRAQLVCVPDEESGATGTLGITHLANEHKLHGLGAIYAYSGTEIALGHRGLLRYRLTCTGESMHTGSKQWQDGTAGANAVTGMARLLTWLEDQPLQHSRQPYFDEYRTVITPGTVIQGGTNINIVPDFCEALLDVRTTPEYDAAQIEALFEQVIAQITAARPRLHFSYQRLIELPAAISDENADLFRMLETLIPAVTGQATRRMVSGPANEGYLLIRHGIPTVCGLGPAGANAHGVDEYVEVEGLLTAATLFALTARRMDGFIK